MYINSGPRPPSFARARLKSFTNASHCSPYCSLHRDHLDQAYLPSLTQPQRSRPGLPRLQLVNWNPSLPSNESPPTCIHYSIEWKMLLKKGRLLKLTERLYSAQNFEAR
ncbi:hypothetical protein B0T26DRAFT_268624 [Lasiosphaeria miniovina]|uniref:Uncharacterized protein n=1 Tax=Lasiosphaeria miniovina TaxID=1954250 RepID=A0AA40AJ71_9PEZI|nr:uncharacterized protein B0T26DRAFT_268624 [Lasiosphaeria miniovina]KAK0716866.1 hypothetical protein B0T26DRAFT_268624 [Lasiosphaeria miniovina]